LLGLGVAFVEVEGRVELGLARKQFLQPRLVLEGPPGLGLIVGESFFEPLNLLLFVCGGAIEGAQRGLNALVWCRSDCRR
jgi:hypothetical protein